MYSQVDSEISGEQRKQSIQGLISPVKLEITNKQKGQDSEDATHESTNVGFIQSELSQSQGHGKSPDLTDAFKFKVSSLSSTISNQGNSFKIMMLSKQNKQTNNQDRIATFQVARKCHSGRISNWFSSISPYAAQNTTNDELGEDNKRLLHKGPGIVTINKENGRDSIWMLACYSWLWTSNEFEKYLHESCINMNSS